MRVPIRLKERVLTGGACGHACRAMLILGVLVSAVAPASAWAAEGEPLRITKFSMQTTKATVESLVPNGRRGSLESEFTNEPYVPEFTQAGGHPWGLTTKIDFATQSEFHGLKGEYPTRALKDIVVGLPPGLLGNPLAVPRCSAVDAVSLGACPAASQIGVYRLKWLGGDGHEFIGPIVDVVPERGQSAEFVFENEFHISFILTAHLVRIPAAGGKPASYGFTVSSDGIPSVNLYSVETTFWGVPSDPSHDAMRGLFCGRVQEGLNLVCTQRQNGRESEESGAPPVPFLTMATDCAAGPQTATVRADSWEEPGSVREGRYEGFAEEPVVMPGVTGCNVLAFEPSIVSRPDTLLADEPVGMDVRVGVPLNEDPESRATPQLRNAVVTLPEGVSVSPGVVDGIEACNEFGPEGIDMTGPESETVNVAGELALASGHCPDASAVGTAEAVTPLLPEPVRGHVYLARPGCGGAAQSPCTEQDVRDGNLYKLYLELGGEGELSYSGVHIKVEGRTEVNPATGQLTTIFEENPQAPFTELKVHLNGGPRAPLANPAVCGPAVTTADFTPWSAPGVTPEGLFEAGTPDATPSSFFYVGGPKEEYDCPHPTPFAPGFVAGMVTPQAGQYSAFTLNLSREDREQYVKGIQVHTPPGLLGMLSSVPLCGEPQADQGTCPESAKIGTTRVATGAGSHPFEIEGGVYLTGPYDGSPFGLSIVVHVIAGPFNLGDVVVRARIAVDPENSTLTITTDETGPYAIPQIVFGVPVRLKRITVDIDRSDFMFNPTNCAAHNITAKIAGSQEATSTVSSPFAVGGCKSLEFKPSFVVSTSAHTSRTDGASLDAKVSYPAGSVGDEANIASVKVELPKQLPARLTTLQKACTAQTFEANPADCPAASVVGIVKASTPLLPVGLSGPVYFVSHGGEAFPSLIMVLQGDGVRVDLTGSTFISKAGITSSTFKTVPDVPVNSFELYLPEGPYSALGANRNLCASTSIGAVKRKLAERVHGHIVHRTITTSTTKPTSLLMPSEFVAQNGTVLKRNTTIAVTGCAASKTKAKKKKPTKAKKADNTVHGRTR